MSKSAGQRARSTVVDDATRPGASFLTPKMIVRLQEVFDDLKAKHKPQKQDLFGNCQGTVK